MEKITALFTKHPASVGQTYGAHFLFAIRISTMLMLAAMAALIHAILPFLFEKTASQIIVQQYKRIHDRATK